MTVNKTKKIRKQRRSRTHGWGSPKKHRGSGSKGGSGKAGMGKKGAQKKTLAFAKGHGFVGDSRGFVRPGNRDNARTVNLSDIEQFLPSYLENGIAVKEGNAVSLDLSKAGVSKVLGSGKLVSKIKITAAAFSAKAKEKIESVGGEAIATATPQEVESKEVEAKAEKNGE